MMVRLDLNGAFYNVNVWGDTQTRQSESPVLLLHGFTGSSRGWVGVAESLIRGKGVDVRPGPSQEREVVTNYNGCGRYVIAVDALGHGESDSPEQPDRYSMARAIEDIYELLRRLRVDAVHLLGYSMGGRIALAFAVEAPERVRSLVLESASPGLRTVAEREERERSDVALANFIEREGIAAFVDRWESLPLFATQEHLPERSRQFLRDQRLRNNPRGLANSLRGMGTGTQESYWERLGGISCPVLIVTGIDDLKYHAIGADMAALLTRGRHMPLPGGHNVHFESPDAFTSQLAAFIALNTANSAKGSV